MRKDMAIAVCIGLIVFAICIIVYSIKDPKRNWIDNWADSMNRIENPEPSFVCEKDGVIVYKYRDCNREIYFTNKGQTIWNSGGKSNIPMSIE